MNIRERFEEIWPVPEGVYWSPVFGAYVCAHGSPVKIECMELNLRLDTFTRCQETTEIYVSIIDEVVSHMGIINDTSTDLRAIGIARESIGLTKQKLEQIK